MNFFPIVKIMNFLPIVRIMNFLAIVRIMNLTSLKGLCHELRGYSAITHLASKKLLIKRIVINHTTYSNTYCTGTRGLPKLLLVSRQD